MSWKYDPSGLGRSRPTGTKRSPRMWTCRLRGLNGQPTPPLDHLFRPPQPNGFLPAYRPHSKALNPGSSARSWSGPVGLDREIKAGGGRRCRQVPEVG